ncbi:MAG TPA: sugar ABC transporter permease [Thermotogota bacterium]|nr:sugar ABC transporter permease [Thermotogota bacterium]
MLLKAKTREALIGYLFAAPIILSVLMFEFYPIITAVFYSFTQYQPLQAQQLNNTIVPEDTLSMNLMVFPDEPGLTVESLQDDFDLEFFIETDVGITLSERQREALQYFNTERLLTDFLEGKLKEEVSIKDFMSVYLKREADLFVKYKPKIVGLENFAKLLDDQYFWLSLKNTVVYTAIVVPIQTFLAVILAVVANRGIKGRQLFKIIFFLPAVTSSAALSMIFKLIYAKPGVLNKLLNLSVDWLQNPSTALIAIMIMNIWSTAGYFMVTYLAGLQNIPKSLYEASEIDGANFRTRFTKITLPLLRPQILFVSTMGIIGCMQVFDQIYFLIKNMRNITLAFYIYRNAFEYSKMGYASALSMVLFALILIITFAQKKFIKEESYF